MKEGNHNRQLGVVVCSGSFQQQPTPFLFFIFQRMDCLLLRMMIGESNFQGQIVQSRFSCIQFSNIDPLPMEFR
ncbi:hypothetical protein P8452_64671 [Trifolium repens]|nr:hypothetical protein P8452_64671 [Trifolium repens]